MSDKPTDDEETFEAGLARLQHKLDNGDGWTRADCAWILSTLRELQTALENNWIHFVR